MCNELSTCLLLSFVRQAFFARMLLHNRCDDNAGVWCNVRTTHDAYVLIVHQSTHTQVSHHHTESVSCVASIYIYVAPAGRYGAGCDGQSTEQDAVGLCCSSWTVCMLLINSTIEIWSINMIVVCQLKLPSYKYVIVYYPW